MTLTSVDFLIFVALTVAAFNVAPERHRAIVFLLASVFFYAQQSLVGLGVLGFITITAFTVAPSLVSGGRRRLAIAIVAVLAPLVAFKYSGALASRLGLPVSGGGWILPVGLSFFTFHAISYLVDVHRGDVQAERRFDRLALYLWLFPKLLAGPIERAGQLLPQLQQLSASTHSSIYVGLKWTLWGFFCKLVVADNIGAIVDTALRAPAGESGLSLSLAFGLYAFQLYFDFLGYTSIAIGIARCFGLQLSLNFDRPYSATSLRDFWHRWHISLSSWFRDYLYIPLGGNRTVGWTRWGLIGLVFVASGIWHGATLNFALWGGFHGVAYAVEERVHRALRFVGALFPVPGVAARAAGRCLTFGIVTIGWIPFRTTNVSEIPMVIGTIAGVRAAVPYGALNAVFARPDTLWFLAILFVAITLDFVPAFRDGLERVPVSRRQLAADLACFNWLTVTLVLLGDLGVRDFTYLSF